MNHPAGPARRQHADDGTRERPVPVTGIPDEGVVIRAETHVGARREQVAEIRCRKDPAERRKVGSGRLNRRDAPLVVSLVAREKERSVLTNRPANIETELAPPEERVRISGVAAETWIRR